MQVFLLVLLTFAAFCIVGSLNELNGTMKQFLKLAQRK